MMSKTSEVEFLAKDPVFDNKNSTIDEINNKNKVCKAKSKNMIIFNLLIKSKLLIESNYNVGFVTF